MIPPGFKAPEKLNVGPFKPKAGDTLKHGLKSGDILILDAKTFFIADLHYKGDAPKAFFWVGNGSAPHEHGIKVPDENQS
jgi:Electron transfer DM13